MEFKGLTSASHMSLPEAGYGSEEGYVGSEISGAVWGVTTPGASRLQASQLQQRSTTMQRLHVLSGLISMLPLIGVASYVKYDGFCYIDYRDVTHCVLWLLIMVPCVFGVLVLYVQIYKRSGLSKTVRFGLLGFWFLFLCGWVLGIATCLHI